MMTHNNLFRRASARMIMQLDDQEGKSLTQLSKDTEVSYAHTFKLVKLLREEGLLNSSRRGRCNMITLSLKGCEVKNLLMKVEDKLR